MAALTAAAWAGPRAAARRPAAGGHPCPLAAASVLAVLLPATAAPAAAGTGNHWVPASIALVGAAAVTACMVVAAASAGPAAAAAAAAAVAAAVAAAAAAAAAGKRLPASIAAPARGPWILGHAGRQDAAWEATSQEAALLQGALASPRDTSCHLEACPLWKRHATASVLLQGEPFEARLDEAASLVALAGLSQASSWSRTSWTPCP
mmetsp:Transcript_83998/g.246365  ORF Transcript_83998/g.246365 Transcript_83998/m.246365 type:complete len:207 (-) Transcript_83998:2750-3370(-)